MQQASYLKLRCKPCNLSLESQRGDTANSSLHSQQFWQS